MKPAPKHTTHNKLLNSISYIYHIYIDMCVCVENICMRWLTEKFSFSAHHKCPRHLFPLLIESIRSPTDSGGPKRHRLCGMCNAYKKCLIVIRSNEI